MRKAENIIILLSLRVRHGPNFEAVAEVYNAMRRSKALIAP